MTNKVENIVTNESKGYGYNYASLGDIAKQGFEIPKMKTEIDPTTLQEYVYYYDKEIKDWIKGAKVVVPENIITKDGKNKMNAAQLYGSALTYARRYTTLMALQLVCDDDVALENTTEEKPSDKQISYLKKLYSEEEQAKMIAYYKVSSIEELSKDVISKYINDRSNKNANN